MVATGSIRAGRAFVEVFADNKPLLRGLNQAAAKLKTFGAGVRALGTKMLAAGSGIVTPLLAAAKVFGSMGDEFAEMSARTGISVEALSSLGYAANQSECFGKCGNTPPAIAAHGAFMPVGVKVCHRKIESVFFAEQH